LNNRLIEAVRTSRFTRPFLEPYRMARNRWIHRKILNGESIPIPKSIAFEVTQRCNLNCKMCFYRQHKTEAGLKELTIKEIGFLFREKLSENGFRNCFLTGSEPFMRNDIEDIIKIITNEGMEISFQTNGTLITEERLKKIFESSNRIALIGTSCEGFEMVHNRIRGRSDAYKRAMKSLEIFKKKGISVNISVIVLDENLKDVVKLPALLVDYSVNQIDIGLVANYNDDEVRKSSLITGFDSDEIHTLVSEEIEYKNSLKEIQKTFYKTIENGENRGLKVVFSPALLNKCFEGIFNRNIREKCLLTCAGFFSVRIAPDASIIHCPFLRRSFGNLLDTSLETIWNSIEFREFRRKLLVSNMLPTCTRCGKLRELSKGIT